MSTFKKTLIWLVATLFVIYSFTLNTAAAVFSESIKNSLQTDDLSVALASGTFILGFALMQIPAGYLLDRFNTRNVVCSGIFILALGNIIISFAENLTTYSLANLLQGIGASFAFIAGTILIARCFSKRLFPILFGFMQSSSCIAAGIIHYYFTLALTNVTFSHLYEGLAISGLSLFLLAFFILKMPNTNQVENDITLWHSLKLVCRRSQFWLCCLSASTSFGVLLSYASYWYMPVQAYYSTEHLQSVVVSGMIFVGIGVGTPIIGFLSNYLKSRIMLIHISLVLGTMTLLLGLYLPHFNTASFSIIRSVSFLIGFFLSGSLLFYTMVNEMTQEKTRGVAMSILNTCVFSMNTLMLLIPYLFIVKLSGQFFTYLWVLPFFVMFSILPLYFIHDTLKPKG